MKDVSVVNSWMLSQTGTKAELIRLFLTECCSRFREVPRKFLCVERTQTRIKTLSAAYRAGRWLSTEKPFHTFLWNDSPRLPSVAGVQTGVLKEP